VVAAVALAATGAPHPMRNDSINIYGKLQSTVANHSTLFWSVADQMDVRVRHICATQVDLTPKVRQ
jgi:hypothetical protein